MLWTNAKALLPWGAGWRIAGFAIAIGIGVLMVALLLFIQNAAISAPAGPGVDVAHFVRMSGLQAALSTAISLGVGMAIAWALNRLRFWGRDLIVGLFAVAIVAPGMVVAAGLIAVWGRAGWINAALAPLGFDLGSSIFGLHGIIAAHVLLNGSFAARILLARLDALPATRLKTGQSLGLDFWQRFRFLDWPALAPALPGLGAIIFLLSFTSFPIVLLLGGGPANQTLEVAIYANVRLNFDLANAVQLALVQLAVCALFILPAVFMTPAIASGGLKSLHHWSDGAWVRRVQGLMLTLALIGFALPLLAVLAGGFTSGFFATLIRPGFQKALLTSLAIGSCSALLSTGLAIILAEARLQVRSRFWRTILGLPVYVYLVVPAVVLSLGFFLGFRGLGIAPVRAAPLVLVLANALLALPFAVATLGPALQAIDHRYRKLGRALNLTAGQRWRLVQWPLMGRELGIVLALGFCFSLGDLGVISLFGTSDFTTLPWLMLRALGAYRSHDAAIIAAFLLGLCLLVFWIVPPLMERWSNARN